MIKINMGCGKRNFGKDWIHIDSGNYSHLDHDNIFNFPFENIDLIYASHLIEYFDLDEVKELLNYWLLKLKKGGILRLAVPNFRAIAELYLSGIALEKFIGPLYGKMQMGNEIIYHKNTYDYESLYSLLSEIGFSEIRYWDHREVDHGIFDDHSQAYIPHMDKDNGTLISLNVECKKL